VAYHEGVIRAYNITNFAVLYTLQSTFPDISTGSSSHRLDQASKYYLVNAFTLKVLFVVEKNGYHLSVWMSYQRFHGLCECFLAYILRS
jgi:hypothetical protein